MKVALVFGVTLVAWVVAAPAPAPEDSREVLGALSGEESDRAAFLELLEELNAVARDEPRPYAEPHSYIAMFGVFESPTPRRRPLVFAERIPFDFAPQGIASQDDHFDSVKPAREDARVRRQDFY